ncbi:MAG: hypothetical protein U1E17_15890 [Geminicoccaceae bacterium]
MFAPDLFLVDKEPLGLRGEVRSTLEMLQERGTRRVLGLRDVMDEPTSLVDERWTRRNFELPAALRHRHPVRRPARPDPLHELLGLDALAGRSRSRAIRRPRARPRSTPSWISSGPVRGLFILVTPGGGGDGAELIDWVIRAYEADPDLPHRAVILFGPFMPAEQREAFQERCWPTATRGWKRSTFEARVEPYFERASAWSRWAATTRSARSSPSASYTAGAAHRPQARAISARRAGAALGPAHAARRRHAARGHHGHGAQGPARPTGTARGGPRRISVGSSASPS